MRNVARKNMVVNERTALDCLLLLMRKGVKMTIFLLQTVQPPAVVEE